MEDVYDVDEFFVDHGDGSYTSRELGITFLLMAQDPESTRTDGKDIFVPADDADLLTVRQLNAVLAHEQGHINLGHVQEHERFIDLVVPYADSIPEAFGALLVERLCHRHEYEADRYAASLGYGEDLIEALDILAPDSGKPSAFMGPVHTHPTNEARARALGINV